MTRAHYVVGSEGVTIDACEAMIADRKRVSVVVRSTVWFNGHYATMPEDCPCHPKWDADLRCWYHKGGLTTGGAPPRV